MKIIIDDRGKVPSELRAHKIVACDTETTGLAMYGNDRPFAFSFTTKSNKNFYFRFPVDPFTREVLYDKKKQSFQLIKEFYEDGSITKIFHNANFDILMLKAIGIEVHGLVFDTMVLAHVYDPSRFEYGLKPLTLALLGFPVDDIADLKSSVMKARREGKKLGWALAEDLEADYWMGDPKLCEKYAVGDTDRTMMLYLFYMIAFENDLNYRAIVAMEMTLLEVVRDMTHRGHKVNLDTVLELKEYYENIISVNTEVKKNLGFENLNPKSPKQMFQVFYEQLKMPPICRTRKKKTGEREKTLTTDTEALYTWAQQGNELATCLVELTASSHQLSSFIIPFKENSYEDEEEDWVLHPSIRTLGSITGRMSCSKPNLMNISDAKSGKRKSETDYRARECFVPRKDHVLYYADYSQVEVWIAAFLSQDKIFMQQLLDGVDIHTINATNFWGYRPDFKENFLVYRKKAKSVTFGCLYGAGDGAVAVQAEVSLDEARRIRSIFWNTYSGLRDYGYDLTYRMKNDGHIINPFGRKYMTHPDLSYKSLNYMVQGSASEVLKSALINVHKLYQVKWKGCHILIPIHDEKVSEIPISLHSKALMKEIVVAMQGNFHESFKMKQPFKIGMSYTETNWSEKQEVEL